MIVRELIDLLQQYPAGLRVVVNGYDDLSPQQISRVEITLNTGKYPWEGQHGSPRLMVKIPDGTEVVEALVLRRMSD